MPRALWLPFWVFVAGFAVDGCAPPSTSQPAAIAAQSGEQPLPTLPRIKVRQRDFVDDLGALVLLRGINVGGDAKVPPFKTVGAAELAPLPRMGFNVVRLLFIWEAYEPERGAYNDAYLEEYLTAVEAANNLGLYVIIDIHQDAFSRYATSGCGDGFPRWALPAGIRPHQPRNGFGCVGWAVQAALDRSMQAAWQAFYADKDGVRSRYLTMLARLAAALGSRPGILGYDLLNEPWGDEPTELAPLLADGAATIHHLDPEAIIFVSPGALTSTGAPTRLPRPEFAPAAFSAHDYDAALNALKIWLGTSPGNRIANLQSVAEAWNVPLFLGEFGAPASSLSTPAYLDAVYDVLDQNQISGTQWVYAPRWTSTRLDGWNGEDFSIVDDHGRRRGSFLPRPYPARIAGTMRRFAFSNTTLDMHTTQSITLSWEHDPNLGLTEVRLPDTLAASLQASHVSSLGSDVRCRIVTWKVECQSPTPGPKQILIVLPGKHWRGP